jgi:hypothetical protein
MSGTEADVYYMADIFFNDDGDIIAVYAYDKDFDVKAPALGTITYTLTVNSSPVAVSSDNTYDISVGDTVAITTTATADKNKTFTAAAVADEVITLTESGNDDLKLTFHVGKAKAPYTTLTVASNDYDEDTVAYIGDTIAASATGATVKIKGTAQASYTVADKDVTAGSVTVEIIPTDTTNYDTNTITIKVEKKDRDVDGNVAATISSTTTTITLSGDDGEMILDELDPDSFTVKVNGFTTIKAADLSIKKSGSDIVITYTGTDIAADDVVTITWADTTSYAGDSVDVTVS